MDLTEVTAMLRLAAADDGADPLGALRAAAQVNAEMERQQAVLVRRARVRGATWVQIADALGVSKQAVHKKYGRKA